MASRRLQLRETIQQFIELHMPNQMDMGVEANGVSNKWQEEL